MVILPEVGVHEVLQAWDDVQRKVKPLEKPYDYQRARPLNQEKSTRSLAEVYEEEYVEKTKVSLLFFELWLAATVDLQVSQPTETEDVRHVELEKLKNTLFVKLDALTNFYFTPKPVYTSGFPVFRPPLSCPLPPSLPTPQPHSEPCVVSNVSAVVMEEALPTATAQHTLLAPEEVQVRVVAVRGRPSFLN